MNNNKKYLTIHGHFYQPPRENPWLEEIEIQESAYPQHDWNEKISWQCYRPNGVSRIVDCHNKIIDISNNYQKMSFNFGPTLLSWLEKYDNDAYQRIIKADINSRELYEGHGCAMAQVYNHIILPLANRNDKITQVLWGLKDFQKRFKRNAQGIWLAETAVDAQTLEVLIECGVKFTILSPHQAKCVSKIDEENWQDVSWGSIDPSMPYRYYVEGENKEKYIDIFFYDGSISKSVAFDNLLQDGMKFAYRLNDGYVESRNRPQLINIATDGESYGHHTKFGDMALAYVLNHGAKNLGFEITNYSQFLAKYPPEYQVDIKPVSAWSCCHGVGRWCEDCGCSTGAQAGWNQKWRKPLRQALDYLRDELIRICTQHGTKYYKDFWEARNNYIDVILDRSPKSVEKFLKENAKKQLNSQEKSNAIKLMEIQRNCQLMYTSCGWFFADISGIETTQILKYALRAIELSVGFTKTDLEKTFTSILQKAKSNIKEFGSGKDIFESFVKSSSISFEKIAAQAAIEHCFETDVSKLYCYDTKITNYKEFKNLNNLLTTGKIEIFSNITLEKKEFTFVLLRTQKYEFYCAIKKFVCKDDFNLEKKEILELFNQNNIVNTLQTIELYYGSKFYTLKDIPIDRRKNILENLTINKLIKTSNTYKKLYSELLAPICYLNDLGMDIPDSFRVCAKYTLLTSIAEKIENLEDYNNKEKIDELLEIKQLAEKFYIKLNKSKAKDMVSAKLKILFDDFQNNITKRNIDNLLNFFELIEKLEIDINIQKAQNIYYEIFCENFEQLVNKLKAEQKQPRVVLLKLLELGRKLDINIDFYKDKVDVLTGKIMN